MKNLSSLVDPFLPEFLDKLYVIRKTKSKFGNNDDEIENNLNGLFNYFSAPNIRHKVKKIIIFIY